MREKLTNVVENDYLGVIKRKMEYVYSIPVGNQERGLEREKRDKDQRQAFTVSSGMRDLTSQIYLNDLDISADYMDRLIEETLNRLPQVFLEREVVKVKEELGQLNELSDRFRSSSKVCWQCATSVTHGRLAWSNFLINLQNLDYADC